MRFRVQCSAVIYRAVHCSAVNYRAVQCSAVQCSAVHYRAVQCSVVQDDTDGQVASLCRDEPGVSRVESLLSFPSYRTARSWECHPSYSQPHRLNHTL